MKHSPAATADVALGVLLETFVNRTSYPRGRALAFMAQASVTVDQAILLNHVLSEPDSTPTSLAERMSLSLPSMSQMLERLVRLELVERTEDTRDRRRKTIHVTSKAKQFLKALKAIRVQEFDAGTFGLTSATKHKLSALLTRALAELDQHKRNNP
jgi:DNA-binding MarR family transcriptional regulator